MLIQLLNRHRRLVQALFWLTLLIVLGLSLKPYSGDTFNFHISDKVGHFLAYLALGGLMGVGWSIRGMRPFLAGLFALIVLGGGIEILQATHWIGRTASWLDLLANAFGAASGLAVSYRLHT